jgi:glyoxylase I family protein
LHHLCFQVRGVADVDLAAKLLREAGIEVSAPKFYPEYTPDYYAIFFCDPDDIEVEIVNRLQAREAIAENWETYPRIGA